MRGGLPGLPGAPLQQVEIEANLNPSVLLTIDRCAGAGQQDGWSVCMHGGHVMQPLQVCSRGLRPRPGPDGCYGRIHSAREVVAHAVDRRYGPAAGLPLAHWDQQASGRVPSTVLDAECAMGCVSARCARRMVHVMIKIPGIYPA